MFDLWFTELMYISNYPYKGAFSYDTWRAHAKCKFASERMRFYWDN
jgi:hypothetical protein